VTRSPATRRREAVLYGARHKRLRRALLPSAVGSLCSRCGRPILEGQAVHLDHFEGSTRYRGWAHSGCNLRAGGQARQRQLRAPDPQPRVMTTW